MTWVIGAAGLLGAGVLVSDTRVQLADGTAADLLQKAYPIANYIGAGFAGYVGSRAMFEDMNRALTTSGLKPVIDKVYPFEATRDALRYLESAKHFGKIVVVL